MKYYKVSEVADQLNWSITQVYKLIRVIEKETPHQFAKMFLGNYYRGNDRKEKVVVERDLLVLKKMKEKAIDEGKSLKHIAINYYQNERPSLNELGMKKNVNW